MNELLKKKGTNFFSTLKTMTLYNNPIVQSSLQSLLEPCPEGLTFCTKTSVYLFKGTYSLINSFDYSILLLFPFFFFFFEQTTRVINYTEKVIYLLAEQIELILSLSESCLTHRDMLNFTQFHTLSIPSDSVIEW